MSLTNATSHLFASQYFDDWYTASNTDPSITRGEEFDFHRILFRPRIAVQSRELTQLQTILQHQLERLGKAQFKDGEAVFGGQLSLDTSVLSGRWSDDESCRAVRPHTNAGKYVFDTGTPTTKAHVLQFLSADEGQTTNNYLSSSSRRRRPFVPGTVVQAADDATITATFAAGATPTCSRMRLSSALMKASSSSRASSSASPTDHRPQPVLARPSYRIGLGMQEQVLDELDDVVGETLLDPANQNAPGATASVSSSSSPSGRSTPRRTPASSNWLALSTAKSSTASRRRSTSARTN
jgi:hypothetical protein